MQNPRHSLLLLLSILTMSISLASADSINGCGGFVEASSRLIKSRKPGDAKLDYSHITVELRTVDGLVKDRTQCAPNGYYFIPVYDKGSFVLAVKGPDGWSWLPDKVKVLVDNAGCNGNEDINFKFTGFAISGRVVGAVGGESCSHKTGGPVNVDIELVSSAGDIVSSVQTSSDGSYLFKDIAPGKYKLHASHPDMKIEVRGSAEVELGFGNSIVDDIFFAAGYDIRGSVVAQGNPILGVHVFLYSDDVAEVDCPDQTLTLTGQRKALCQTVSDAEGMFTFKSIPCGTYELKPYYKGENTVFDVSPPVLSVSVEHQHVMIPQRFQVTGFSVGGRVLDGNDDGVDGVKIVVDGHERSITDNQGYYKLDQVTSNRYTIEARKEHYKFDMLKDYTVLPNMASIADIKAVSYDVCGTVRMVSAGHKAKVALTHGPENVKPQVRYTDAGGRFCFEVPPGEYRLAALAANPESAPGLLFLPPYTDVVIKSPLLNLEFSQALVNIHGHVDCKDKCGSFVSVFLMRLAGRHDDKKKVVSLTDDSSNFIFQDVIPGKYRLEVKHTSLTEKSGEGDWCWEHSSVDLDVGAEDVKGVVFTQKGFWISIISTHDVNAFLAQPDGSTLNLNIKKGPQRICVEFPGVHELHFIDSCVFFGSPSVKIDTSNSSPIILRGEKYLLKGQIDIDAHSLQLPAEVIVDVINREGIIIDSSIAKKISDGDAQKNTARFEYSLWADIGDKLTLTPQDSGNAQGKRILFYPRQRQVLVESGGCQSSVAPFSGREGLYIEGSVSPPISDVDIKVTAVGESQNAPLRKGESAFETTSAADGRFAAGPLYDDTTYRIEASKPGYHLKQVGPNSFSCQKLGQISVRVYSKDDAKEPIPSVLLSLSGDDGYRNNSVSGAGGTFLFDSLFPGSFYLRPLLKEYAFSPSAQAVELGSGEAREIVFEATRVAYSAIGSVTSLSGQPKDGVSVEARSVSKGYYEETVTDSSGSYRLRGLLPDTTYTIRIVRRDNFEGTKIERASPETITIKVGFEDVRGLDFVVFEQPESTILSGHVERQKTGGHSQLLVEIKSATDPSRIVTAFPVPLSNFFQVKGLPKSKHRVQLRSEFPSATHRFESKSIEVDLEENSQIHVGPLTYTFEENYNKQDLNVAPLFPLIAGISVIALLASMPRLKDIYQATVGSPAGVKKEVKKPVSRRRIY